MKNKQSTLDNWRHPGTNNTIQPPQSNNSSNQTPNINAPTGIDENAGPPVTQTDTDTNTHSANNRRNQRQRSNLQQTTFSFGQADNSRTIGPHLSLPTAQFRFDIWGHEMKDKNEDNIRIVLRNISSLPQVGHHNKNDLLLNEILSCQADVYCATEINVAWQNIDHKHNIHERYRGKFEFAKIVPANNKDKNYKGSYQPGGSIIFANGKICGRITEAGTENNLLQRWAWIKICGKNKINLILGLISG